MELLRRGSRGRHWLRRQVWPFGARRLLLLRLLLLLLMREAQQGAQVARGVSLCSLPGA